MASKRARAPQTVMLQSAHLLVEKRNPGCFYIFYFLYFAASSDPPVALPLV